jgi:hypothetical protein
MVPFKPYFDRGAQVTFGLVAYGPGLGVGPNGVALLTQFLYGQNFSYCEDPVTTNWTACVVPATTWSAVSLPVTVWLDKDGQAV